MTHRSISPDNATLHATGSAQQQLHEQAAALRTGEFGSKVFVRGVVELSNFCRENCAYCGMRRDNRKLPRYRANPEQLAELILRNRPQSITDINIQTGEDPVAVQQIILPLIKAIRRESPLGVSVCLGTLSPALYAELQNAGASTYIIKFETADPGLYQQVQGPGTLDERLTSIRHLASTGWHVSSGFIAGLPDHDDVHLLANFRLANELPIAGCSVSPFVPGDNTPLQNAATGNIDLTLNCMAVLRLMRPDWMIPAVSALNISDPVAGYRRGLHTGASLVTINLTPKDIRGNYVIYKRDRFVMTEERILAALEAEKLTPATETIEAFYRRKAAEQTAKAQSTGAIATAA